MRHAQKRPIPFGYTISIRRSLIDGRPGFEAKIAELPDVVEYSDTRQEVYDLAIDTIETTAKIFAEQDRVMPPATAR